MHDPSSPAAVVERYLDAYNQHDIDALIALYADDACQFLYPAQLLAQGTPAIRERMAQRFADPALHATLLQRTVMGCIVVDHEVVRANYPEGLGSAEVVAIYEVRDGKIQSASVTYTPVRLD
ncbi:MAG: nuclear transport factor 2 family protein [Pseudomonadota bacterium]